jgi:aminoglycoside phosphotransferase family enzyme
VSAIELVETHVSWIVLTGEFAYKIKRPVRYAFIAMRDLERRGFLCGAELRLNRRFAPELYLEVCVITSKAGGARIGGQGHIIEYAVRMRRFDRESELDQLLESGRVEPQELEMFGRTLAEIHAELPIADSTGTWGDLMRIRALILQNVSEYEKPYRAQRGEAEFGSLKAALETRLREAQPWLSSRSEQCRIRECHGGLHSRNIVRLGGSLLAFDCMEFEPAFRWIDVADEIAMLLADPEARGYPAHARAFLDGYLARSGDYQACRVLDLYRAHRALVRAKVAALRCMPRAANSRNWRRAAKDCRLGLGEMRANLRHNLPIGHLVHGLDRCNPATEFTFYQLLLQLVLGLARAKDEDRFGVA